MNILEAIIEKNYDLAREKLNEELRRISACKLEEMKKMIASKVDGTINRTEKKDVLEDNEKHTNRVPPQSSPYGDLSGAKKAFEKEKLDHMNRDKDGNTVVEEDASEESSMARSELQAMTKDAKTIMSKIKGNKELEAWTQSKITKAADYMNAVADYMEGEKEEPLDEARINTIKARIRGGQIQRRKKVSNVPGYTLRGGKMTRMSATERRRRRLGAKIAARKTKGKKTRILMKRKRSLQKRHRLGI